MLQFAHDSDTMCVEEVLYYARDKFTKTEANCRNY